MNETIDDEMPAVYFRGKSTDIPLDCSKMTDSNAVYFLMKQVYGEDVINHHEEFWVLYLNIKNKILKISKIAQGGISENFVDIRLIFQEALKTNAVAVILTHNHPSGEPYPSKQDIRLTQRAVSAGEFLNIKVLDHLIICDLRYYSFANDRKL